MFNNYKVVNENGKDVLYLFINDYDAEFSKEFFNSIKEKSDPKNLKDNATNFINRNKINFKGNTVKIVLSGLIVSQFMMPTVSAATNITVNSIDYYTVEKGDSLWSIGQRYGLTVDELMDLNNLTSTNLSIGQKLIVSQDVDVTPEYYTVVKGDTLWIISQRYGMTVKELMDLNNLTNTTLSIGQVLKVSNVDTPPEVVEPPEVTPPEEVTPEYYTVVKGDTLWDISQRYGMTVKELMDLNNLTSTTLSIGQVLKVSDVDTPPEVVEPPEVTPPEVTPPEIVEPPEVTPPEVVEPPEVTPPEEVTPEYYTVVKGDTLWDISQKYGMTVKELMNINNLTSTTLSIGQVLIVSNVGETPPEEVAPEYYTVVKGDTLWDISQKYGMTVKELMDLNNLTSTTLSIGQVLLVTNTGETPPEEVTPEYYTVVKGDTLWDISQKYGMTVKELMDLNNLTSTTLSIGQVLLVTPGGNEGGGQPGDNEEIVEGMTVTLLRANGTVETILLEDYIIGVVASEMPAHFHEEALKAQALAARTYAIKRINQGQALSDTDSHQVYKDNGQLKSQWGNDFDKHYNKVKSAVMSTEGQTIKYNGDYIDALYFSTSNGKTQSSEYVWGGSLPYIHSVDSAWDRESPMFSDTKQYTVTDFNNKLNSSSRGVDAKILSRTDGGYVDKVSINGTTYTGNTIRQKFGLRSSDFDITVNGNYVTFTTRGWGHGVGMSQYGAHYMALDGYTYDQILTHYYLNVTVG